MDNLCKRAGFIYAALLIVVTSALPVFGGVLDPPPSNPDPSAKYLFYMHGRYVENQGADKAYRYAAVLKELEAKGLIVFGEIRSTTTPGGYSAKIIKQVSKLIEAGVPAKNITVAGHSKGGFMSMLAASRLKNKSIKYGVMAGCGVKGSEFWHSYKKFSERSAKRMRGRFLIAWDADDDVTLDCDLAMQKAGVEYRNLEFETGKGHQLFYTPDAIWIDPLAAFALSE